MPPRYSVGMFRNRTTPVLVARSTEADPEPPRKMHSGARVDVDGASEGDVVQITDPEELDAWREALRPMGLSVAHVTSTLYRITRDYFRVEVDTGL